MKKLNILKRQIGDAAIYELCFFLSGPPKFYPGYLNFYPGHLRLDITGPDRPPSFKTLRHPWNLWLTIFLASNFNFSVSFSSLLSLSLAAYHHKAGGKMNAPTTTIQMLVDSVWRSVYSLSLGLLPSWCLTQCLNKSAAYNIGNTPSWQTWDSPVSYLSRSSKQFVILMRLSVSVNSVFWWESRVK